MGMPSGGLADSDWVLRRLISPEGTNLEKVRDTEFGAEGEIWFSSWGNGVARLQGAEWTTYNVTCGQLASDFVPSLCWDQSRQVLWVGHDEGLVAVTPRSGVFGSVSHRFRGSGTGV